MAEYSKVITVTRTNLPKAVTVAALEKDLERGLVLIEWEGKVTDDDGVEHEGTFQAWVPPDELERLQ